MTGKTWLLLMTIFAFPCTSRASFLDLSDGVRIKMQDYAHRRIACDGSTCVDFIQKKFSFSACFFKKSLSRVAEKNGFFRYENLSEEGKRQIQSLPQHAMVYAEGSCSWLYQATLKKVGNFNVYESTNVLCRDGSTNTGEPATCYVAALEPSGLKASSLSVFITSVVDKPPSPSKGLSKIAQYRVDAIHAVIESIQIIPHD